MNYPTADDLAPNDIVFRLETNQAISPASFGTVLREIERIARLKSQFGPDTEIGIVDMGTGSAWARIRIGLTIAAEIAAVGALALTIEQYVNRPSGTLAEAIAVLSIDDSVVEARIVTRARTITIATNELPARQTVEQKRLIAAGVREIEGVGGYGRSYGMDYGGKPITLDGQELTLDNERLSMDGQNAQPDRIKDWAGYFGVTDEKKGPISATGGVTFGGTAKLGQLRHFVGRLHPGRAGHSDARLEGKSGTMYHLRLATELLAEELPWGMQVVVAGTTDADERDVVHASEIIRVTEH